MAARLGPADPQRIVRALEVIDATGVSLAEWQGGNATPLLAPGDTLRLVIAPEREPLYAAIDARFDRMIEDGALDEVRALLGLELDPGLPAMRAHGVRELAAYLSGALDPRGGFGEGQDREPPLRQAADDVATALHVRLGLVPRCCTPPLRP